MDCLANLWRAHKLFMVPICGEVGIYYKTSIHTYVRDVNVIILKLDPDLYALKTNQICTSK